MAMLIWNAIIAIALCFPFQYLLILTDFIFEICRILTYFQKTNYTKRYNQNRVISSCIPSIQFSQTLGGNQLDHFLVCVSCIPFCSELLSVFFKISLVYAPKLECYIYFHLTFPLTFLGNHPISIHSPRLYSVLSCTVLHFLYIL